MLLSYGSLPMASLEDAQVEQVSPAGLELSGKENLIFRIGVLNET
jgi:hypothetical protein